MYDLIVIGGGAAGFFAALAAKRKGRKVAILEKTATLLAKVRVSGGGRCNVTHACFDPIALSKNYPRGEKELIGPFHRFQPQDTIDWFLARGVALKTESDGRMFPTSNSSETIIRCLMSEAKKIGVEIFLQEKIERVEKGEYFTLHRKEGAVFETKCLLLATGSSSQGYVLAKSLGHGVAAPVPSLFTFNAPDSPLKNLSGIAVKKARVSISGTTFTQKGPLLITHFGFSGPAILKLSAFAARWLYEKKYHFELLIDWGVENSLQVIKKEFPSKTLLAVNPYKLPKNLWKTLLGEIYCRQLRDISGKSLNQLEERLSADRYEIKGKTTHKEEFVTCGGINLKEVNFKTMESRCCPGLFFAGEILDIDGVTGGFNFQNAWTTGFIAGESMNLSNYTQTN